MGKTELKLEIDSDLLDQARDARVELSTALEDGVKLALAQTPRPIGLEAAARRQAKDPNAAAERAMAWKREKSDAIASFNQFIEDHGSFGDDLHTW
jgi:post-segregation antitoxin (ccd killing protein)